MTKHRAVIGLALGVAFAVACGNAATVGTIEPENTTEPTLPDGAPNPSFDPSKVPPTLPDGAPNPVFDATMPDGAVLPGFDAQPPPVDAGRDSATPPPADAGRDSATPPPVDAGNPGAPGVVSLGGIAAWDALPAGEKARVNQFASAFLHQSVGQDMEDGIEGNGVSVEFMTSGSTLTKSGIHGGLFSTGNGNGPGKVTEWRNFSTRNGSTRLKVAIMKFGYADILGNLTAVQTSYQQAVTAIKAAGIRVLHVTPPLVYNLPGDNAPKEQMRTWMLATFPNDVIFDLTDVESIDPNNGSRCTRGGSWEICNSVRSTSGCPSVSQGVDAASGQGHLCTTQARRISKGFLYAIYQAGK